jgi:uncharacterized membrane protein YfcA
MMHDQIFILLFGIGGIAGLIDAIAGGGGLLTLPTTLAMGLPPHIAIGTSKLAGVMGVLNSNYVFLRKRIINPRYWLAAIFSALVGGAIGTITLHFVTLPFLTKAIPLIIIFLAVYMMIPKHVNVIARPAKYRPPITKSISMGGIIGMYDGFIGAGSGSFYATFAMILFKVDLLQAAALARLMNLCSSVTAILVFICFHSIDYAIGISLGIGYMLGSYIGAHLAIVHGKKIIKPLFLIVVCILAGKLIWQQWF